MHENCVCVCWKRKKVQGWMTNLEEGMWLLRRWQHQLSLLRCFKIQPSSLQTPTFPNTSTPDGREWVRSCSHIMTDRNMKVPFDLLTTSVLGQVHSCHVTKDESLITFASCLLSATQGHPGNQLSGDKCGLVRRGKDPQVLVQKKQL